MRLALSIPVLLALVHPAHAELPDPVDPETIGDGLSATVGGGVLGEATRDGAATGIGELALEVAWTNSGLDLTEGFRGPRWTNRWGARMSALATAGSGDRPLALEQRGEVAIYGGSIGETLAWQSQPRLTDRLWYRTTDRFSVGGFVDFGGIGVVKLDGTNGNEALGAEGFPIMLEATRELVTDGALAQGDHAATTLSFDIAIARVAGRAGDLRIIDENFMVRDTGHLRAATMSAAAISIRRLPFSKDSPWSLALDIWGLTGVTGYLPYDQIHANDAFTVMPYGKIGIAHHADAQLHVERSQIGRPIIDDTDFGVELGTLHRLVEAAGIDEGGQLLAWGRVPIERHVSLRGEAMLGLADRVRVPMTTSSTGPGEPMWVDSSGLVTIARGELELSAQLAHGFSLEARAWIEHSERADPTLPARWTAGIQSGVGWKL
jgi:hypothetical protein